MTDTLETNDIIFFYKSLLILYCAILEDAANPFHSSSVGYINPIVSPKILMANPTLAVTDDDYIQLLTPNYVFCPKLWPNNNVIDGNMDEFNEESDESHDCKSNSCGNCDLLKFFSIWFCASFYKSNGIFTELLGWLKELHNLIHFYAVGL